MSEEREDYREEHQSRVGGIYRYFSGTMGVFYMVLGVLFYLFPVMPDIDGLAKLGISSLLFIYGIFRLWRAIKP